MNRLSLALLLSGLCAVGCSSSNSGGGTGGEQGAGGSGGGGAAGGAAGASSGDGGGVDGGSGADGGGQSSGVQGSKALDALTTDEKKLVCDFRAQHYGGYGMTVDCGGGNRLFADISQATCLSNWPATCPETVAQDETCTNETSCSSPFPPSCNASVACH